MSARDPFAPFPKAPEQKVYSSGTVLQMMMKDRGKTVQDLSHHAEMAYPTAWKLVHGVIALKPADYPTIESWLGFAPGEFEKRLTSTPPLKGGNQ